MKKIRITDIQKIKDEGKRLVMLTAYDAAIASIIDDAGVDIILIGDSLGNVVQGLETTLPVTIEDMIYHTKIVSGVVKRSHVSSDMPFMSYQISKEDALKNAGRLVKEGGAESVKLEVNDQYLEILYYICKSGIPVVSHIGLCPQSIHMTGGYRMQGKSKDDADVLFDLAVSSQEAGAFLLVLESIPSKLAKRITEEVKIPTIGIGAGKFCDGQVLVFNDMVGLSDDPLPRFVKKYAETRKIFKNATEKYAHDVRNGKFPSKKNIYE